MLSAKDHQTLLTLLLLPLVDYSEERVGQLLNADLADTMGNLLQRVTSKKLNPGGPVVKFSTKLFPLGGQSGGPDVRATDEDYALVNNLIELPGEQS